MDKDIIRIAEAIFGADKVDNHHFTEFRIWHPTRKRWTPFDPRESHADRHALIEWLGSNGWHYECYMQPTNDPDMAAGCWLHFWQAGTEIHHRWNGDRDLHNEGVVKLTLKILESDDEES